MKKPRRGRRKDTWASVSHINDGPTERIERRLAYLFDEDVKHFTGSLVSFAFDLNGWARHDKEIAEIRKRFLNHPCLGPLLAMSDKELMRRMRFWPEDEIPKIPTDPKQAELIVKHLPLVKSLVWQYAPHDASSRDDLERYGLDQLLNLFAHYDAARGVTFSAFVRRRLMGAMRDYIRNRGTSIGIDPKRIDALLVDKSRKLPPKPKDDQSQFDGYFDKLFDRIMPNPKPMQRARESTAKDDFQSRSTGSQRREELTNLTARYLASGGEVRRKTPTLTEDLQRAIAKLNARQQAVYRGRVLTDPPVTRDRLARQLGIRDSTQISRIQGQAERKVAKIIKPKVSP